MSDQTKTKRYAGEPAEAGKLLSEDQIEYFKNNEVDIVCCGKCDFWYPNHPPLFPLNEKSIGYVFIWDGECRHRSPSCGTSGLALWPTTKHFDVCGEFKEEYDA